MRDEKEMTKMRSAIMTAAAFALLFGAGPAAAQENYPTPWCSSTSGIGKECYQNLAQCQQNIQGNGGFCSPTSNFKSEQPLGYGEFPQRPNE
jgi:hypothetical protein